MTGWRVLIVLIALLKIAPAEAAGQSAFTAAELNALEFHQHPGAALPLKTPVIDEDGHAVELGRFFRARPVILVLDYLHCQTLCGFMLSDLATTLDHVPLAAGRDFEVVALSIDPREGPADSRAARQKYFARADSGKGWHFLTASTVAIRRIADAVGFPYRYDPTAEQYAHPAGLTIATEDGTIARYILGIDYRPLDLRLALTEAANGAISTPATNLLLLCYCYDPATGRYSAQINLVMRILGGITVIGLVIMLIKLSRVRTG